MLLLPGAVMATRVLRVQQKAMPVIGFLGIGSASPGESRLTALWQGLVPGFISSRMIIPPRRAVHNLARLLRLPTYSPIYATRY
jgi:hypothetical protein